MSGPEQTDEQDEQLEVGLEEARAFVVQMRELGATMVKLGAIEVLFPGPRDTTIGFVNPQVWTGGSWSDKARAQPRVEQTPDQLAQELAAATAQAEALAREADEQAAAARPARTELQAYVAERFGDEMLHAVDLEERGVWKKDDET